MNYEQALARAVEELPETPGTDAARLEIPRAEGESDGAFTRLTNIEGIAEVLDREPEHLHRSIQRDLGTNGQFDGQRARYNGTFTADDFDAAIESYVAEYVTCSECQLPDTVLVTEDGIDMLRCQACGAFRPVAKRSRTTSGTTTQSTIEEGHTYEVKITGTGRKGDGVAEKGRYTIFVPGTSEGDVVTAYIESINGNLAFARLA